MKSDFWIRIDEKFLVRLVQLGEFNIDDLMANVVIYKLYRI